MILKKYISFMKDKSLQFINESKQDQWIYDGDFEVTKDMVQDGKLIKDKIPDIVNGNFDCDDNQLTSLEGGPKKVGGTFWCNRNKLTNLKGAPEQVGRSFNCNSNQLTSLEGVPEKVAESFVCSYNKLTTLEGGPKEVGKHYRCNNNKLTTLEGSPVKIGESFICDVNKLTNLEGAPVKVVGNFNCRGNQLTSLEGAPKFFNSISVNKELIIEEFFTHSKNYRSNYDKIVGSNNTRVYWEELLKFMIEEKIDLDRVEGWPEGFLNDNVKKSAKGTLKYKL